MATGDTFPSSPKRVWQWALWTALMLTTTRVAGQREAATVMGLCAREPAVRVDCYPPVDNFPNVTEEACFAQGCCWKPLANDGIPCAFDVLDSADDAYCAKVPTASRVACRNPRFAVDAVVGGDPDTCHAIGCCFDDATAACFQPFFEGYELLTLDETPQGWRGTLVLRRFKRGPFGNDVALLDLHVIKESASRVRVRITDPSFPRYEVPGRRGETEGDSDDAEDGDDRDGEDNDQDAVASDYHVHFYERPFGMAVTRRKTHEVLFNSTPSIHANTSFNGLVFENQFLEISTHLEQHDAMDSPVLYGLGERWGPFRVRADREGDHYPMFSRRTHTVAPHTREGGDNLGGVHPFYLQVLSSGRSHGVYFRSSNAMEVVTQDRALTFRSTGGVIDFVVFSGPTAADVASEYTKTVGRPEMPPFWALGYHFGKQGRHSLEEALVQVTGLREAGVPLDAFWQDVGYMYHDEAFSLDKRYFPREETKGFIDDLHFNNQYYVALMTPAIPTDPGSPTADGVLVVEDPGILKRSSASRDDDDGTTKLEGTHSTRYYPLERGREMDVFVKGIQGEPYAEKLVGSQWSAFVDFSHPNATAYWREMLSSFHEQVLPFDGVWVNVDEPSSTCDIAFSGVNHTCNGDEDVEVGSSDATELARRNLSIGDGSFVRSQDVAFPFDPYRQPFVPGQSTSARGGHGNLNAATLPMASLQQASLHYNLHSLYGHQQSKTTRKALDHVLQRRSISMSRATFAGDGKYGGQLSHNFNATWENLRLSIASVIQNSLLGIPFSGPSVGGSGRGMTKELSIRWNQAASFFPLFRNHAAKDTDPQSPIDFDPETLNIAREGFLQRYKHLPYMYSQFFHAHAHGQLVIRSLALEFSDDPLASDIETQYLVGPALMVSPVVDEQAISARVYFPNATWYDLETGRMMVRTAASRDKSSDRFVQVLAPLSKLPVHVRGGYIIPTQQASSTTAMTRRGVYRLVVALEPAAEVPFAVGDLYIDDGDSLHSVRDERYSMVAFKARLLQANILVLTSNRTFHGYDGPEMQIDLDEVVVFGLRGRFFANSSLHIHGASRLEDIKANYFEQADMLVLTRVKNPIGEPLNLRIEATSAIAEDAGDEGEGGEAGVDRSREGEGGDKDEEPGKGAADAHGGKAHDKDDKNPPPITGEQHKKKGMSITLIIGIIAGIVFFGGLLFVAMQRRRRGYQPIT